MKWRDDGWLILLVGMFVLTVVCLIASGVESERRDTAFSYECMNRGGIAVRSGDGLRSCLMFNVKETEK